MGKGIELLRAARLGKLGDLKTLLSEEGIDLEYRDEHEKTPLFHACIAGHEHAVTLLLEAGANVNICSDNNHDGWTPLIHEVCGKGHTAIAKLLLDKGASVTATDDFGNSVMHIVASSEIAGKDMIHLLLRYGADLDDRNYDGETPIFRTTYLPLDELPSREKMKMLIDAGADLNQADYRGFTPLHRLALSDNGIPMASILLEHGADAQALNKYSETHLQVHYYLPSPAMIKLLLDYDGGFASCKKKGCGCGLAVDMCCYNKSIRMNSGVGNMFDLDFEMHTFVIELYSIKMKAAGILPLEDSERDVVETGDVWRACKAELAKMKKTKVGNQNVTFASIWNQRPAALRRVESFNQEEFSTTFPIYSTLIRRRYLMGRRRLIQYDKAQSFFPSLSLPKLPSIITDMILDFLNEADLQNLLNVSNSGNVNKRPKDQDGSQVTKLLKTVQNEDSDDDSD